MAINDTESQVKALIDIAAAVQQIGKRSLRYIISIPGQSQK